MFRVGALCLLLTLSGCVKDTFVVYTDYLSHRNLASYRVGTPDPALDNPPFGQRLIVSWVIPKNYWGLEDLHIDATIRLRNRTEVNVTIPICKRVDSFIYPLINQDYVDTGGFLAYKMDLIGGGVVLEEWRHQLWVELIELDDDDEE